MKHFFLTIVFFAALSLSGCSSSPYTVIERTEGFGSKQIKVKVAADTSLDEMQAMGKEIEASEKVEGKDFMVNFFDTDDGSKTSNMLGFYSDGSVTINTGEMRLQERNEGD